MAPIRTDDLPVAPGTVAGTVAWVLGFALTYALVAPEIRDSAVNRLIELVDGSPATYELVGWVFYNAHFVNTVLRDVPVIGTRSSSYIGGEGGFSLLLYVVPVGLLLAAGLALARYQGVTDPVRGALAGATALPGYLLLSVVGVFLTEVTLGEASGAPDLLPAVLLAGVAYPILCGGLGGAVGALLARRSASR